MVGLMKRKNNIYYKICDIDNIIYVYNQIKINNKVRKEKFNDFYSMNIVDIYNKLNSKNYIFDKYNVFTIYEPKKRIIMSLKIKDKIVNHLVAFYFLDFENSYVNSNVAARLNKGSSYGIKLIKKYLNQVKNKNFYILKFDIKKYFYSINHTILKKLVSNRIKDKDALNLIYQIIDSTNYINDYGYVKGKGIPIGNMTSQVFGIFYLNDLDHYIKEVLKIKYYCRYMDDGVLIHEDKNYLKYCLFKIKEFLIKYDLELNHKTKIYSKKEGVTYLGFRFIVLNNKVIVKVKNSTKLKFKKRIKKLYKLYKSNKIPFENYYQVFSSYKGHLGKGNCYNLIIRNQKFETIKGEWVRVEDYL